MNSLLNTLKNILVIITAIVTTTLSTILPIHKPKLTLPVQNTVLQTVFPSPSRKPIASPISSNLNYTNCNLPLSGTITIKSGDKCSNYVDCWVNDEWIPAVKSECDKLYSLKASLGNFQDTHIPIPTFKPNNSLFTIPPIPTPVELVIPQIPNNIPTYTSEPISNTQLCGQMSTNAAANGLDPYSGFELGKLMAAGCVSCNDYINYIQHDANNSGAKLASGTFYCNEIISSGCSLPASCQ